MMDVADAPAVAEPKPMGLFARVGGIIVAPRATFEEVARRPRTLGVLTVVLAVLILSQGILLSTQVGQDMAIDQQIRSMEAFGVQVTDEQIQQMESRVALFPVFGAVNQLVFIPLVAAIIAGLLHVVLGLLGGAGSTFKHVYAIVAHSGVIIASSSLFTMPLSYAAEEFAGANLGVFFPMLEEGAFLTLLLDSIDLFMIWWVVTLSIGVAVYYKRRTGPIATALLGIYVAIVLIVAFVRS